MCNQNRSAGTSVPGEALGLFGAQRMSRSDAIKADCDPESWLVTGTAPPSVRQARTNVSRSPVAGSGPASGTFIHSAAPLRPAIPATSGASNRRPVTMAEVGFPGRPITRRPLDLASQTGLPGFMATFEKIVSNPGPANMA